MNVTQNVALPTKNPTRYALPHTIASGIYVVVAAFISPMTVRGGARWR